MVDHREQLVRVKHIMELEALGKCCYTYYTREAHPYTYELLDLCPRITSPRTSQGCEYALRDAITLYPSIPIVIAARIRLIHSAQGRLKIHQFSSPPGSPSPYPAPSATPDSVDASGRTQPS